MMAIVKKRSNKKDKRNVLVTGATGFIGANLVHRLLERGDRVHVFLRKESNTWRINPVLKKLQVHNTDIRDSKAVQRAVTKIQPRSIFHLASYGAYPFQSEMDDMIETDIIGTVSLLEAARAVRGLEVFISAGSSTEYGFKKYPMREDNFVEPNTAYGVAKASQTLWSQFFASSYGLPVVVVRPSLVYGSYEEPTRLIPDTIVSHLRGRPLALSSPFPKKDFVYIDDVIDALLQVEKKAGAFAGHIFNIASGKEYSVGEVLFLVRRLMKKTVPYEWGGRAGRTWDTDASWVDDISKADTLLKWRPKHSFEEGLTKTIAWFEKNHELYP